MPSLRQLEYLVALADVNHFRRAAEKVGVSQPTLSAQLSALESALGVQLVERSRSRVLMTPLGANVVTVARQILGQMRYIREMAASQKGEFSGVIRLGLPPTIGPYLLPRLLPKLHRTYPELKLYVREEVPHSLPLNLEEGRHDVLIVPLPVHAKDLQTVSLFREPLFLTVSRESHLAESNEVERRDLRDQDILTLEAGHQLREQVDNICEDFGARVLTDYEGTSLDTLRQMVSLGMGSAFFPGLYTHSVLSKDRTLKVMQLKGRSIHRTIGMLWRKSSTREQEFLKLAEHVRESVKQSFPNCSIL